MTKISEYDRGFQNGVRWSITWLHKRANEMNDPHAKNILNSAAFGAGVSLAKKKATNADPPIEETQ